MQQLIDRHEVVRIVRCLYFTDKLIEFRPHEAIRFRQVFKCHTVRRVIELVKVSEQEANRIPYFPGIRDCLKLSIETRTSDRDP